MARWEQNQSEEIPKWFWDTIKNKSVERMVEVEECDVCYRRWGSGTGQPLLFVHGMYAHSRWWDFVAPHFLDQFDPLAMDLTGMGDSDFRYDYDGATYANEIKAVCDDAELSDDVILIGHSFGGRMALKACATYRDRFKALILVDSGIHSPDEELPDYPPIGGGRAKTYPSRELAEARFRLYPPQPCENQFLLQYIAKHSLMPVEGGFSWKYDEDLPIAMVNVEADPAEFESLTLPTAIIYGSNSISFTQETLEYTVSLTPDLVATEVVEGAQHHVFLDQPLAFVNALNRILLRLE